MKRWIFSAMSVAAVAFATTLLTAQSSDEPTSRPSGPWHENGSTSRPGGPGGHRGGFHLLPPFVMDKLNLTDDQKKALAELEKETKAKLDKILTDEQKKILDRAHPPFPGGPGGHGRPGQGGNGPNGGGSESGDSSRPARHGPPGGDNEGQGDPPPSGDGNSD